MTLRSRLAVGLLTIAIILIIPLLLAIQSLTRLRDDARGFQNHEFSGSLLLGRLRESLYSLGNRETALLFVHLPTSRDQMAATLAEASSLADSLARYQLTTAGHSVRQELDTIDRWAPNEYQAALANRKTEADSVSDHFIRPAMARADSAVAAAEADLRVITTKRVADATAVTTHARQLAISAMLLALAIAAFVAVRLTRSISRPVVALEAGMRAVADGDLTHSLEMNTKRQDEFGRLAQSFEEMTRQLVELDKLKAEFVSVASHELKTPINVIMGYLQLFDEGLFGPLTEKQTDVHKTLELQSQALLRLVNQLLDVSRFEAGGGRLEPRRVPLEKLLDDLRRSFDVLSAQRGIAFAVERHEGLPAEVTWDPDRINEVLGNLLSNAFKFTPRGGRVDLIVTGDGNTLHMDVRDTGAGIPPEQLPRIFEKFYQADNQRSASARGSGLGLAIAKGIVEAHGGTITCESTVGVGTTFSITLPTRAARRTSAHHLTPTALGAAT